MLNSLLNNTYPLSLSAYGQKKLLPLGVRKPQHADTFNRLTFSAKLQKGAVADLRAAWQTPDVRRAIEFVLLSDLFKETPARGAAFVQKLTDLCNTDLPPESLYKELRKFYLTFSDSAENKSTMASHAKTRIQRRVDQLVSLLDGEKPKNLLDVGYGDGAITDLLARTLKMPKGKVFGAEIIKPAVVPSSLEHISFDGKKLPLEPDQIDLTLLLSVLHHVEDFESLLKDIFRVTRPGGRVLVRDFDAFTEDLKLFNLTMDFLYYRVFADEPDVPNPGHFFSASRWVRIFKKIGFVPDKIDHPESLEVNPYKPFYAIFHKPSVKPRRKLIEVRKLP